MDGFFGLFNLGVGCLFTGSGFKVQGSVLRGQKLDDENEVSYLSSVIYFCKLTPEPMNAEPLNQRLSKELNSLKDTRHLLSHHCRK